MVGGLCVVESCVSSLCQAHGIVDGGWPLELHVETDLGLQALHKLVDGVRGVHVWNFQK